MSASMHLQYMAKRADRPLVSIIIPCWNCEGAIGEAIQSALDQTYSNIEVIVVDDGSTDASLSVIRSFGTRVRWQTGPNQGACSARNRGLGMSRGQLVQFLDADDVLAPRRLSELVPVALQNGLDTMTVSDGEIHQKISPNVRPMVLNYAGEDPLVFLLGGKPMQTPSPLHWRVNLERIQGFDETLPCCQERDLHLRLALLGLRIIYVRERLYIARKRGNSISSNWFNITKQHQVVFSKALALARASGKLDVTRRAAFAKAFARDARLLQRQHGRPDLAREFYSLAESTQSGASVEAFGNILSRIAARTVGPVLTERIVGWLRPPVREPRC